MLGKTNSYENLIVIIPSIVWEVIVLKTWIGGIDGLAGIGQNCPLEKEKCMTDCGSAYLGYSIAAISSKALDRAPFKLYAGCLHISTVIALIGG